MQPSPSVVGSGGLTARSRPRALTALVFAAALGIQGVAAPAHADALPGPTDGGRAIVVASDTREIAHGITHSTYDRIDEGGTNHIDVLRIALSATEVEYLDTGVVAGVDTLSNMAASADVDVAVNGDFFDINNSGAVLGAGIDDGEIVKSPNANHRDAAVVTEDGVGAIARLILDGVATVNGTVEIPLAGINMQSMPANSIAAFDDRWGTYTLTRSLGGANQDHHAVRVGADGRVLSVPEPVSAAGVAIGEGEHILLARGTAAVTELRALAPGDDVEVAIGLTDDVDRVAVAMGGSWASLVDEGVALDRPGGTDAFADGLHPRTAIGFGADGTEMFLVTVDGRQAQSRGMSLSELGRLMLELGATEAMNLDGGGSTTMVVRDAGLSETRVVNSPSDGGERLDGNGLGVVSNASDGVLSGLRLEFGGVEDRAQRIFPGLTRTVAVFPHDAGGRPVAADVESWTSSDEAVATVADGVVTAVAPGNAKITATSGDIAATIGVTVLEPLERIEVAPNVIQLSAVGESAPVTVTGFDAQGFRAPIAPADISVDGASGEFTLEPASTSTYDLVAVSAKAGGLVTVRAGDAAAELSFLIGRDTHLITDMSDPVSDFYMSGARSGYSFAKAPGEGRDGSDAMRMSVDFTRSTSTRTANLWAAAGSNARRNIEGQAVELHVTIKADGVHDPMIYALVDNWPGREVPYVYGPRIAKHTDWQTLVIPVPQGYSGPFYWHGFSLYETAASLSYKTSILIDSIELVVAPVAEAPEFVELKDYEAIAEAGAADESPSRIAVMSDAQFVGRAPESALVEGARRTLREMVAAEPDAVYILGDFTDEAADADFELARRILEEELVPHGIPWTYVPGNHEIMGEPIDNFISYFGDNKTTKDVGSTRIITLDSSPYDLDFEQLEYLHDALQTAETDDAVTGVLVMFHHPTRDFLPNGTSGLRQAGDADLVEEWLERFSANGKHVSLLGAGVGAFHARHLDGVIHYTNGNSGKAATSNEAWGGWRGWTMVGVDPAKGNSASHDVADWLTLETRPWVDQDSLAITAPTEVVRGTTTVIDAAFTQDGIAIPVRWPVSATWSGERVHVGPATTAPPGTEAVLDPRTREITFLQTSANEVELKLEVNGATTSHVFTIWPEGRPAPLPTAKPSVTTPKASKQANSSPAALPGLAATEKWIRVPAGERAFDPGILAEVPQPDVETGEWVVAEQ